MTTPKIISLFKKFLAQQGITAQFSLAIKSKDIMPYKGITHYITCHCVQKGERPEKFIENAFSWFDSNEGREFWERHSNAWVSYLKVNKNA